MGRGGAARLAAGKSTLVKLLPRMYRPTSGRITADGVDIETIAIAELRSRLAGRSRTSSGGSGTGRVTLLVSHRFSTVRMAHLIVVLDGSRVVEFGRHEDLLARRGQYAELFSIQAASYASR